MNPSILRDVRAIAFDAVGTLIHPQPAAAWVYADVGRRHGSRLDIAEIGRRFGAAFAHQETIDRDAGWRTSEERELRRWREIVAQVLDDVSDPESCFRELYQHFAAPDAWQCGPSAARALRELGRRGYRLALASNYDERLRRVLRGLPALRDIDHVVISAEVGWRKPAPAFFDALCRAVDAAPEQVVFVGDDRANDFDGAVTAGLRAVLLDQRSQIIEGDTIRTLDALTCQVNIPDLID